MASAEAAARPEDRDLPDLSWADHRTVVAEGWGEAFKRTLARGCVWDPRRNPFALIGLLWALPIPVFSTAIDLHVRGLAWTPTAALGCLLEHKIHLLALLHIPAFVFAFGLAGSVLVRSVRRTRSLVDELSLTIEQLKRASAERDELEQLKDEFISNLTHELKTPLSSTCAYAELMLQGRFGDLTPKQNRALTVGLRNLRRLESLINDMLEMARLEAGQVRFVKEPFPVAEVLEDVVAELEASAEEKGVALRRAFPSAGVSALADRDGIRTVVLNLLGNAIKFTAAGGSVTVEGRTEGCDRMVIEVHDTGVGIPESAMGLIFQRFRQVHGERTRRHGGAGLGLAIVKRILDEQGIGIQVSSSVGKGSTFRFALPLAAEAP